MIRQWTIEDIINVLPKCNQLSDISKALGLQPKYNTNQRIRKAIIDHKLNVNFDINAKQINIRTTRQWTDQDLVNAISSNEFLTDVLKSLQLSPTGGNFYTVNKYIARLNLDTSHFCKNNSGQHKRGGNATKPLSYYLVLTESTILHQYVKDRIFKEGILEKICASCGLGPTWNGQPLTLQVDHIDGNRYDHREHNLQPLCPNCHTQTETYGSKNTRYNDRAN